MRQFPSMIGLHMHHTLSCSMGNDACAFECGLNHTFVMLQREPRAHRTNIWHWAWQSHPGISQQSGNLRPAHVGLCSPPRMHHRWPAAKPGILVDAAGSRMFSTATTETLTSFTFAQFEPAVDWEENRSSKGASKSASCTTWEDSIGLVLQLVLRREKRN